MLRVCSLRLGNLHPNALWNIINDIADNDVDLDVMDNLKILTLRAVDWLFMRWPKMPFRPLSEM